MRLIHFAHPGKAIMKERLKGVLPEEMRRGPKPRGLWVSDEDETEWSWSWWCKTEMPEWIEGTSQQEVVLVKDANVLLLSTMDELLEFTERFAKVPDDYPEDMRGGFFEAMHIDWPLVASMYDGIVITPYIWSCRLDGRTSWYYGWDCASGCIWNPAAIDYIVDLPNMAIDTLEGVL